MLFKLVPAVNWIAVDSLDEMEYQGCFIIHLSICFIGFLGLFGEALSGKQRLMIFSF